MTEEEKRLLALDLGCRIQTGVVVNCVDGDFRLEYVNSFWEVKLEDGNNWSYSIETVKPYLRSIEDMTEEEQEEFGKMQHTSGEVEEICHHLGDAYPVRLGLTGKYDGMRIDWFIERKFDFRGLIGKGLAIKVTPENDPYKKEETV